jgi:hypothetical protein
MRATLNLRQNPFNKTSALVKEAGRSDETHVVCSQSGRLPLYVMIFDEPYTKSPNICTSVFGMMSSHS